MNGTDADAGGRASVPTDFTTFMATAGLNIVTADGSHVATAHSVKRRLRNLASRHGRRLPEPRLRPWDLSTASRHRRSEPMGVLADAVDAAGGDGSALRFGVEGTAELAFTDMAVRLAWGPGWTMLDPHLLLEDPGPDRWTPIPASAMAPIEAHRRMEAIGGEATMAFLERAFQVAATLDCEAARITESIYVGIDSYETIPMASPLWSPGTRAADLEGLGGFQILLDAILDEAMPSIVGGGDRHLGAVREHRVARPSATLRAAGNRRRLEGLAWLADELEARLADPAAIAVVRASLGRIGRSGSPG